MRVSLTPWRIAALVGAGAILLGGGALLAWVNRGSPTAEATRSGPTSVDQGQPTASVLPRELAACPALSKTGPVGLPAAVTLRTDRRRRCGALRLLPDGRVERVAWSSPDPPVPEGFFSSFAAAPGLLLAQRDGRIVFLTQGGEELWRSSGRYKVLRTPCQLTGIAAGERHVAFARISFGSNPRCDRLYIAPRPGAEVPVPGAVGEVPLAWIGGDRLVTSKYLGQVAGFRITLRAGDGTLLGVLSDASAWQVLDPIHAEVVYTNRSQILRIGDGDPQKLIDRAAAGLTGKGGLYIASLPDRRVAVFGRRSLAVLEGDGRVFGTAGTPHGADTLEMRPDGQAAAYLDVQFSLRTSRRKVSIKLLARGALAGRELHAYRVGPPPAWRADLRWSGDWLLAASSDGHAVAIESRSGRLVDLASLISALPHPSARQFWGFAADWDA